MVFVTNHNSTKVLQPGKQPFNLPASFISAKFSPVLCFGSLAIRLMRRNQLDTAISSQLIIKRVRIIRLIANQTLRLRVGKSLKQSFSDKSDFMRRSRIGVDGDRKTKAVCHCHELRAFAPLGFSNFAAPFFATINVPSIKHSEMSSLPRNRKSSAKVSNTRLSLPFPTHSWKRRWQVWYGGNRSGKSHHRAPERNIQSTPFSTSRSDLRGLPRVVTTEGLSNNGSIKDHCSSVNSSRRAICEFYQTIFEMASSKKRTENKNEHGNKNTTNRNGRSSLRLLHEPGKRRTHRT